MSTRQVIVTYSGSTGLDIDEDCIVDDLDNRGEFSRLGFDGTMPTDAQIVAAIERDIAYAIDNHGHAGLTIDGGNTWGIWIPRSAGKSGDYFPRLLWTRLGAGRDRVWRMRYSGNTPFTIVSGEVR